VSRSSTSNSDLARAGGPPRALLLALVLLGAVELGFRLADPREMIAYELGEQEYHAVKLWAERIGSPELAVIGSSRAREAIDAPALAERLGARLGRRVSVGNFACAGGTAEESQAVLDHLLRQPVRPAQVVYGVTLRQLWGQGLEFSRAAIFWRLADWWRAYDAYVGRVDASLPTVLRGGLERISAAFAYRRRVRQVLAEWLLGLPRRPTPLAGQATEWQQRVPDLSLLGERIDDRRVAWYVGRLLRGGRYPLDPDKVEALRRTLRAARGGGVELVVVELPLAAILLRHLPAGVVEQAMDQIAAVCAQEGVRFVRLTELGQRFEDADFLDQSHLNRRGAGRLSMALADRVLVPRMATSR